MTSLEELVPTFSTFASTKSPTVNSPNDLLVGNARTRHSMKQPYPFHALFRLAIYSETGLECTTLIAWIRDCRLHGHPDMIPKARAKS